MRMQIKCAKEGLIFREILADFFTVVIICNTTRVSCTLCVSLHILFTRTHTHSSESAQISGKSGYVGTKCGEMGFVKDIPLMSVDDFVLA